MRHEAAIFLTFEQLTEYLSLLQPLWVIIITQQTIRSLQGIWIAAYLTHDELCSLERLMCVTGPLQLLRIDTSLLSVAAFSIDDSLDVGLLLYTEAEPKHLSCVSPTLCLARLGRTLQ